jgi:hypothetical protein
VSITKVVGFFTTTPIKLSLHFSEFSTIFYAFYNIQEFTTTIEDSLCTGAPKTFQSLKVTPLDCTKPLGRICPLQSHPWLWGRCGWPESSETSGAPGRGRCRGRPHAHLGSGGGRSWGGGVAGVGARRRPAAAAAAARAPVWGGRTGVNVRLGKVLRVLGNKLGRLAGDES